MSNLQTFTYNNQQIDFDVQTKNVMINATEMAKIFGKRVDHFIRSDHAKAFMSVLEFTPYGVNSAPLTKQEMLQAKGQSGTWMHRILALKFAAWLDPAFEVWVYSTIDEILFGKYRVIEESLKESADRRNRIDELQKALATTAEFQELERLQLAEKQASYRRSKANTQQIELFRT